MLWRLKRPSKIMYQRMAPGVLVHFPKLNPHPTCANLVLFFPVNLIMKLWVLESCSRWFWTWLFLRGCGLLIAHATLTINITQALLWPLVHISIPEQWLYLLPWAPVVAFRRLAQALACAFMMQLPWQRVFIAFYCRGFAICSHFYPQLCPSSSEVEALLQ